MISQKGKQQRRYIICSSPNERGIHRYARYLAQELKEYTLIEAPWGRRFYLAWELIGILSIAKDIRYADSIIFVNTRVSPLLWLIVKWNAVTVVVHDVMDTLHGSNEVRKESWVRQIKMSVNTWVMRVSIGCAGRVICNSNYTRSIIVGWLGEKFLECTTLRAPLSFESSRLLQLKRKSKVIDLEEDYIDVLAVSGMSANKSHEAYFRWHRSVNYEAGGKVRLTLYGVKREMLAQEWQRYAYRTDSSSA